MPESAANTNAVADTSNRELIFTRVFEAPRELVFEAWTDPKHVGQWWGPKGFSTTIHEMEVRPGGVWRLTMHGPDGVDYKNRIVFLEVVKPERLVFKHQPEQGSEPVNHETTVTFAEEGAKTRLTMRMLFASTSAREDVVKKYGAIDGANQTLGRLAEHLPTMATGREFLFTRVVSAPRELVFKAWTEPERLKRWWGPNGFTTPVCELNPRPGGIIRIHMRGPDGSVYPNRGVFHEVVEPERLVFAMGVEDPKGNIILEGMNTVILSERGGKTTVTVQVRIVKTTTGAGFYLATMDEGWIQTLERLSVEMAAESKEHSA